MKPITTTYSVGKTVIEVTTRDAENDVEGRCVLMKLTRKDQSVEIDISEFDADMVIYAMKTGRKKRKRRGK